MSRSSVMTCTENLVSVFLMLNQRIFSADEKAWRTCLRRHSKPSCSFCAAECHQGRGRSNRARATLIGTGPAAILEPPLGHLEIIFGKFEIIDIYFTIITKPNLVETVLKNTKIARSLARRGMAKFSFQPTPKTRTSMHRFLALPRCFHLVLLRCCCFLLCFAAAARNTRGGSGGRCHGWRGRCHGCSGRRWQG